MIITIVDYGVGNLHSISKGLERAGAKTKIASNPAVIIEAECLVFPGVGAFGAAMGRLRPIREDLRDSIAQGTPALGVCLGMQIMFDRSEESPGPGLSLFEGEVKKLRCDRIPQMGWNDVTNKGDALFEGVPSTTQFYFANSFVCHPREEMSVAETSYGEVFSSAVRRHALCGVQFHPEKSGPAGLRVLRNFVSITEEVR